MKSVQSKALSLRLREVLDQEFVREVIDRKVARDDTPRAVLLRTTTSATIARKKVLNAFVEKFGPDVKLSELAQCTPEQLKCMAKLGLQSKSLRWLEEYLRLLDVVLPGTRSVHGMSVAAWKVLEAL